MDIYKTKMPLNVRNHYFVTQHLLVLADKFDTKLFTVRARMPAKLRIDLNEGLQLNTKQSRALWQLLYAKVTGARWLLDWVLHRPSPVLKVDAGQYEIDIDGEPVQIDLQQDLLLSYSREQQPRYQIIQDVLGEGNFAKVYLTHHYLYPDEANQTVHIRANLKAKAIKHVVSETELTESEVATAQSQIPSIQVTQGESGQSNITMPALGESVQQKMAMQSLTAIDVHDIVSQSALLLMTFHQDQKKMHGDVKPANLCIDHTAKVSLIDYGMAQSFDRPAIVSGTSGFIAPEMRQHKVAAPSCDVYALGVTAALMYGCDNTTLAVFVPAYPSMAGIINPNEFIDMPEDEKAVLKRFLESMTATDPNKRPSMLCCIQFFRWMRHFNELNNLLEQLRLPIREDAPLDTRQLLLIKPLVDALANSDDATLNAFKAMFINAPQYEDACHILQSQSEAVAQLYEARQADFEQSQQAFNEALATGIEKLSAWAPQDKNALINTALARVVRQLIKELNQLIAQSDALDSANASDMGLWYDHVNRSQRLLSSYAQSPLRGLYQGADLDMIVESESHASLLNELNQLQEQVSLTQTNSNEAQRPTILP